jgi:hypothetical protein
MSPPDVTAVGDVRSGSGDLEFVDGRHHLQDLERRGGLSHLISTVWKRACISTDRAPEEGDLWTHTKSQW